MTAQNNYQLSIIMKYDFHIHTALSPCADDDMTPNNIVNMAVLCGLDIIAVTDHNSCLNARAVINAAAGKNIIVLPGIEVQTQEEIHVLCLFTNIDNAEKFGAYVDAHLPNVKNKPEIFGKQMLFDMHDNCIGQHQKLLSNSTDISIDEIFDIVKSYGGAAIPAHVTRPSNSVISVLGSIPKNLPVSAVEISAKTYSKIIDDIRFREYNIIVNSDSHSLEMLCESGVNEIEKEKLQKLLNATGETVCL